MKRLMTTAKLLFLETRPQFLVLVPCVLSLGVAMALLHGHFNGPHLLLALLGATLAHAAVNVLNDYVDWRRGTDKLVQRTPFSGGSGMIRAGLVTERQVLRLGLACLGAALAIGIWFITLYPAIAWVVIGGALLTVLYTPVLTRAAITEVFPGVGLGILPVVGVYITQLPPGPVDVPLSVVWASLPAGILVSGLLWINELPDYEADAATGRRHAVLILGRKAAAVGYVVLLAMTYAAIVLPVALGALPLPVLLGLLTIPVAVKAGTGALRHYGNGEEIIPALGQNVLTVLATPALMAAGLLLAARF